MINIQLTDEALWNSVKINDSRAFVVLYNRYWKKLYKTGDYYLKDKDTAEQLVHDVFVVLWRRRQHLDIKNFANYIHVTARYHIFKELKARKISPIEYIENYEHIDIDTGRNEAEEKLDYKDFEESLAQCLKPLPKRCREIYWLSRIENLSNDEIAEKLGISKRTLENQIRHALKHIRVSFQAIPSVVFPAMLITMILTIR